MITKFFETKKLKTLTNESEQVIKRIESLGSSSTSDNPSSKDKIDLMARVCVAAQQSLNLTPHKTQIIGALAMYERSIAEMQTGEGKTLTAAMAASALALSGKTVHIATVNDYLAERDHEYSEKLFSALGLTSSFITSNTPLEDKVARYQSNILYSTAQELGFDYLKDNLQSSPELQVKNPFAHVIIDEADSILIDEATTPLIISGKAEDKSNMFLVLKDIADNLSPSLIELDVESKNLDIKDEGYELIEKELIKLGMLDEDESLYDGDKLFLNHAMISSLAAKHLYHKGVDYLIEGDEILIIDPNTGRAMQGRRWSNGLHQSIEAKEEMPVRAEPPTLASITYQSFFSLYQSISGLTGTAYTNKEELQMVYGLDVIQIPTNKPSQREDQLDRIFLSLSAKHEGILKLVKEKHATGQPILIGTNSVKSSEAISKLLQDEQIDHNVLNAKNHKSESEIISNAGKPFAVTISTQMAGRGTDIVLGGADKSENPDAWRERNQNVVEAGGLLVIGTERGYSSRIDNQLRGRSGRQGDPGVTVFFLSLEDDLVETFAKKQVSKLLDAHDIKGSESIEGKMLSKIIAKAQEKKESIDYESRIELMKYESVLSSQRSFVYDIRKAWLTKCYGGTSLRLTLVNNALESAASNISLPHVSDENGLDVDSLIKDVAKQWNVSINEQILKPVIEDVSQAEPFFKAFTSQYYNFRKTKIHPDILGKFETNCLLEGLDKAWTDHLLNLDILRDGIHLRSFANKDPQLEFQKEAMELFDGIIDEAYLIASNSLLGAYIPEKNLQVKPE